MRITALLLWFLGRLVVPPAGAESLSLARVDPMESVKKAMTVRLCDPYFWSGEDWSFLNEHPVAFRVWMDQTRFVAEVRYERPISGPWVGYYWGCFAGGTQVVIRQNVGWRLEPFSEARLLDWLEEWGKEWKTLVQGVKPIEGTLGPVDCSKPFGGLSPAKAAIVEKLVDFMREEIKELEALGEDSPRLAQEVVRIGDFDVTSDSTLVLLEGLQQVWEVKFIRPERCGEADVLPVDYMVAGTWRIPRRGEEPALTSPVNAHLVKQLRLHSVTRTIRLRE